MNLGADPKKLAILGVLVAAAGYFVYTNLSPSQQTPATTTPPRASSPAPQAPEVGRPAPRAEAQPTRQSRLQEYRPSLKKRKPGESVDLNSTDATLRLDLLAKLQDVRVEGGQRSLFDFGSAPLPKTPEPKVIPTAPVHTVELPPPPPVDPPKPTAPPIPLKYYGYTMPFKEGPKKAFFLDGDEILLGTEGDVLKKRYRVVKIGGTSVVMEDLQFKEEKTVPIEQQVG